MSDRELVLFANEAFYRAFADRDVSAMDAVWSEKAPCACLHPGWGPIFGREKVLDSWIAIIANPESPAIKCLDPTVQLHDGAAYVVCYEEIDGQFLVATNVFVREGSVWKMVHHQSGPTATTPQAKPAEETRAVH